MCVASTLEPGIRPRAAINVGHVVFFVEELAAVESFYREVLGFRVSTVTSIARCSCAAACAADTITSSYCSCPTTSARAKTTSRLPCRDIHEVIGGGIAMNKNVEHVYRPRPPSGLLGLLHQYVNSPTGGAFEYHQR